MSFLVLRVRGWCLGLVLALSSASAAAQPPVVRNAEDGSYFCDADGATLCTGDPAMCTADPTLSCVRIMDSDYCTDADQDSDVICCSSTADCLRGRCVGGYPDVDRVCVVDTPGEDASHLCHEAAGATGMALDRCYSTDGDGGVVFVSHYGDGDCDRDGVLNAFDACDCVDGMGAIDGCPPTMDGGVIPDGGANDASPDAATTGDAAATGDAATAGDTGPGSSGFRGEGGCQCRSAPGRSDGLLALALAVFAATTRRRRRLG